MFFLLIAFIARLCRGFGIFSRNSRFRGINSRLGRYKFPVRMATGIWSQATELPSVFGSEIATIRAESKKFPVLREKPGMRRRGASRHTEKYFAWGSWTARDRAEDCRLGVFKPIGASGPHGQDRPRRVARHRVRPLLRRIDGRRGPL
jgi:hypothetical protein